jgi:SAM-dependent methyltransferase
MTATTIPEIDNRRKDRILRYAGRSVLDVGCGDGRWVGALLHYQYEIYGIDAAARPYGPEVAQHIFKADACHLPFKDQSFDTVLMINVLEHLDDDAALREAYRICRKNIIFSVPHEQEEELGEYNIIYSAYGDPTHLRHYGIERIRSTFASTGFEIREIAFELPMNPFGLFLRCLRLPRRWTFVAGAFVNKLPGVKKYYMNIEGVAAKNARPAEKHK